MNIGYKYRVGSMTIGNPSFDGIPVSGEHQPDISGSTFFVDNATGNDYNTGKSWSKPFKTIQAAIEESNLDSSKSGNSVKRNTIFMTGSYTPTNLTVFPNRCDVIGVGTSSNSPRAIIYGAHVPNVPGTVGTRFFNILWQCAADQLTMMTLNSTILGCEFHNCLFDGAVLSLSNVSSSYMTIKNCQFKRATVGAIDISSGNLQSVYIEDCSMTAAGISVSAGVTVALGGYIRRNIIQSDMGCIVDLSNKFHVINNRVFTGFAKGTNGSGAIRCNLNLAQNNRISATDLKNAMFPAQGTL